MTVLLTLQFIYTCNISLLWHLKVHKNHTTGNLLEKKNYTLYTVHKYRYIHEKQRITLYKFTRMLRMLRTTTKWRYASCYERQCATRMILGTRLLRATWLLRNCSSYCASDTVHG